MVILLRKTTLRTKQEKVSERSSFSLADSSGPRQVKYMATRYDSAYFNPGMFEV